MSGNRDELPERTGGDTQGSSRSRQAESQEAIAERLGIDPNEIATRDTLDRGVQQRLTDEGATAAERQLRRETAADREFVQPADLRANVDRETFSGSATLTEEGRQRAQQRQAEQLRSEAASQSDRFGESDFRVDRSGEEVEVEPTEAARRREAAEQLASQSDVVSNVDPSNVELTDDGARLTESGVERAQEAAAASQLGVSPDDIDLEGQTVELGSDAQRSIAVDRIEQQVGGALSSAVREQGDGVFGLTDYIAGVTGFDDTVSVAEQDELSDIIGMTQQQAQQQARQEARQDFAESVESGSAFSDLPDGVDGASLIDNVDPNEDIVREGDSLALADDVQSQINSQLESDALQQQRQEFAQALESGEAFESGEAPDALGSVDPQTDVAVEDGQLTLADDTQAELVESQIRSQVGATPGLNTDDVLQRAVDQADIRQAIEEQIESQTGTDVRPGLIEDANLDIDADGTVRAERLLLNSRRFDDFQDASSLPDDVIGDANLSVDATEQFTEQVEESIAEQISERNVVDVSPDQIDISGGNVSTQTPESLTIENDQITADGLTESGQSDFARRQLQSIQTTEGVSVDTPVNSQAFANVSATLAQAAEGGGSLSSATRIVAASDTVSNVGDLDDLPDSQIISNLDPEQAEERLGIDASTVRAAQSDIQQRRQQLESDPGAVLESIANNQDEFVEDSTRIGVAGERGQRIRQSARTQINQLEQSIAAGDGDVSPGDVNLSLTDDLSGIRSVNEAGRQAIAQNVDDQLPNFDSSEINVGVSGGEITTSIEDSVRERFVENAERVQEIQVRNEIADETEGIGRRDIEVDAGEGISPSDELVTETLGTDVNGNIESFDQLEQAAETQARFETRQQAIQQVDSQTIGAIDPRNVSVERTETGFEANVSGAAAQTTNLSAVEVNRDTTASSVAGQVRPADANIDSVFSEGEASGLSVGGTTILARGEDFPGSVGEVPSALSGGAELVETDIPTTAAGQRDAVSDSLQTAVPGVSPGDISDTPLRDATSAGRDFADGIIDGERDTETAGGLAGAAALGVAAPEPVSTGVGGSVLAGIALGGAITGVANELGNPENRDELPGEGAGELGQPIESLTETTNEIDIPSQTPTDTVGEINVPDRATTGGEIEVPDQTPATDTGEIGVPSIDTSQLVQRGEFAEEELDEDDATSPEVTEEDIPANPFDPVQERGGTPERFIRDDRDAFVIRNPETTPEINQEQAREPAVDETVSTGVGTGFGSGTGVGAGTEPIAPIGSDVDTGARVDAGAGPDVGAGIDTDTGTDTDVETGVDARFETPTRQQTTTQNTFAQPTINETVPGFETGLEGQPNRPGRTRRPPRRPDLGVDPDETETTESPQFQSSDDLFDSGILSGSEALDESFSR